jgi:hypothetical protein
MTAVATSYGADQLGNASELTNGYQAAFIGAAGVAALAVLVALALVRGGKRAAADLEQTVAETEIQADRIAA